MLSKEREEFKNICNKRLDKMDCSDLKFNVNSTNEETDSST